MGAATSEGGREMKGLGLRIQALFLSQIVLQVAPWDGERRRSHAAGSVESTWGAKYGKTIL
jgi:hypothetical protein